MRHRARILQTHVSSLQASRGARSVVLLATLAGCTATVDPADAPSRSGSGGSAGTTTGGSSGSAGTAPTIDCSAPKPGPSPLRRLTRFELNNTVRDLLGDTTKAADQLPPELKGNGFSNDASALTTSRVLVDAYRSMASSLAKAATADATALAKTTSCDVSVKGDDACAHEFVSDFGQKAFRRALTEAESSALYASYVVGKESATHAVGLQAVIEMALQSPQFLYRLETGVSVPGQTVRRPTSSEMATRLSYLLWGSTPDPRLLGVASASQLDTPEQVKAQAELMLQDARAHDVLRYFTSTLYGISGLDGLERSPELFPTYNPSLGPLFRRETEQFIDDVVWNGAGDFATLFNAPYTFVNGPLAAFYGIPNITGDAFQRVDRDPARRLGLLTHASVLASTTPGSRSNPVVRGKFVFEELFCGHVPSPPVGLNVKEPPADPTRTTRERFLAHREADACKGCHTMLDPIGFGLENFDGVGLWRDSENGKPVDASGELPSALDVAGPFSGPAELAQKIATSAEARNCFAGKWLSFAYGRVAGTDDACSESQLETAFREAGGNVKALLLAATQTDAFLYLPAPSP